MGVNKLDDLYPRGFFGSDGSELVFADNDVLIRGDLDSPSDLI